MISDSQQMLSELPDPISLAPPAIATQSLERRYGKTIALAPTTLSIPQGSIFALLGHNGAGKTTLLKLLVNILRPARVRPLFSGGHRLPLMGMTSSPSGTLARTRTCRAG